jgi:hypothetical protein
MNNNSLQETDFGQRKQSLVSLVFVFALVKKHRVDSSQSRRKTNYIAKLLTNVKKIFQYHVPIQIIRSLTPRQWLRKERQCPRLGWLCGRRSDGGGARAAVMPPSRWRFFIVFAFGYI